MTEEILDTTGEEIVPYLIHFSKRGIVPQILGVEGGFAMTMRKAEGPRLCQVIRDATLDKLIGIYCSLGSSVAYINKYGIAHSDLDTANVIVENDLPVIIDWDKATFCSSSHSPDDARLLGSTHKILQEAGKRESYSPLEHAFSLALNKERSKPLEISHAEIARRAYAEFGVA